MQGKSGWCRITIKTQGKNHGQEAIIRQFYI